MTPTKMKFSFKKRKNKDANGIVIGEIEAPKPVELEIPLLSGIDDVAALINLEGADDATKTKVHALIVEALNDVILGQVRDAVGNDVEAARDGKLPADTYDFVKIAILPPAERRGSGIADEIWDGFMADYVEVMQHHGKTKEKAEMGAKLLRQRFSAVKGNKNLIGALKQNLSTWYANTEKGEDFQTVYELLATKADSYLATDEEALLAAV